MSNKGLTHYVGDDCEGGHLLDERERMPPADERDGADLTLLAAEEKEALERAKEAIQGDMVITPGSGEEASWLAYHKLWVMHGAADAMTAWLTVIEERKRYKVLVDEYNDRMAEVREERSRLLVSRQEVKDDLSQMERERDEWKLCAEVEQAHSIELAVENNLLRLAVGPDKEHIAEFTEDNWTLEHPVECRIDVEPWCGKHAVLYYIKEKKTLEGQVAALAKAGVTDYSTFTGTNRVDCHFCNGVWRSGEEPNHKPHCPLTTIPAASKAILAAAERLEKEDN